jgi:hypothetical protein
MFSLLALSTSGSISTVSFYDKNKLLEKHYTKWKSSIVLISLIYGVILTISFFFVFWGKYFPSIIFNLLLFFSLLSITISSTILSYYQFLKVETFLVKIKEKSFKLGINLPYAIIIPLVLIIYLINIDFVEMIVDLILGGLTITSIVISRIFLSRIRLLSDQKGTIPEEDERGGKEVEELIISNQFDYLTNHKNTSILKKANWFYSWKGTALKESSTFLILSRPLFNILLPLKTEFSRILSFNGVELDKSVIKRILTDFDGGLRTHLLIDKIELNVLISLSLLQASIINPDHLYIQKSVFQHLDQVGEKMMADLLNTRNSQESMTYIG